MNWDAQLILAIISAGFSVILTGIVSYIGWKAKGKLQEIDNNTEFRNYMVGQESLERDDGELTEINAQFQEMRAAQEREHAEVRDRLGEIEEGMAYLTEFVRRIGRAFNRSDLDETVTEPENHDPPGNWRGSREKSDD